MTDKEYLQYLASRGIERHPLDNNYMDDEVRDLWTTKSSSSKKDDDIDKEDVDADIEPVEEEMPANLVALREISVPTATAEVTLSGNVMDKAKAMVKYLMEKEVPEHIAKGIVGNLIQESGLNEAASGDSGASYGLAQWHKERWDNLKKKYGKTPTWQNQLDFLLEELMSTEKAAAQALSATKTAEEAAEVFMNTFERPNKKYAHADKRKGYASIITLD